MSLRSAWNRRFPSEKPDTIVRFMKQTWDDLMVAKLPNFHSKCNEPYLTEGLKIKLNILRSNRGLAGEFFSENPFSDMDSNGLISNRRRVDIRYYSSAIGLDLTFEFKKLQPTSKSHTAYCTEGVLRYVNGKYSKDQPLAFMVGMVDPIHKAACLAGIQTAMNNNSELQMIGGFSQPSALFPQLAEFDSMHTRNLGLPAITLSHLLLVYS